MKNEEIDEIKVALNHYSKALTILDSYDHNSLKDIIESSKDGEVKLTYELATTIIKEIGKEFDSSISYRRRLEIQSKYNDFVSVMSRIRRDLHNHIELSIRNNFL